MRDRKVDRRWAPGMLYARCVGRTSERACVPLTLEPFDSMIMRTRYQVAVTSAALLIAAACDQHRPTAGDDSGPSTPEVRPRTSSRVSEQAADTAPGHADAPSRVDDPEATYRIVTVNTLRALESAISPYTALDLARYCGDGWWEYRQLSRLSPDELLVPGDTPHTSGRSLHDLSKGELKALRVRLHERDGRVVSLSYILRTGADSAREAEFPEFFLMSGGTGPVRGLVRQTEVAPGRTRQEWRPYTGKDELAEFEKLMGEMMQRAREAR